jgi:acetyl-CoA carboxylase biotin carboxyl carrier protein
MSEYAVRCEISGTVWKIMVAETERVEVDQEVIVMEAMKMEIPVATEEAGTVTRVLVEVGAVVREGDDLLIIEVR